jgi:hypothetical protein
LGGKSRRGTERLSQDTIKPELSTLAAAESLLRSKLNSSSRRKRKPSTALISPQIAPVKERARGFPPSQLRSQERRSRTGWRQSGEVAGVRRLFASGNWAVVGFRWREGFAMNPVQYSYVYAERREQATRVTWLRFTV